MNRVFIPCITALLIFNFFYYIINPTLVNNIYLGALTTFVITILSISILFGIQIVGSGVNTEAIRMVAGTALLLGMLFQLNIPLSSSQPILHMSSPPQGQVIIGIGLVNTVIDVFPSTEMIGLGYFLASLIGMITFISGIDTIVGGG